MRKIAFGLLAGLALLQAGAAELQWMTDVPKAKAKAKAENKLVMMDFTGSDWCGWCIKLNKEIFSQPEFAEYAAKKPAAGGAGLPPAAKAAHRVVKVANEALQEKYKVRLSNRHCPRQRRQKSGRTGVSGGWPKAIQLGTAKAHRSRSPAGEADENLIFTGRDAKSKIPFIVASRLALDLPSPGRSIAAR